MDSTNQNTSDSGTAKAPPALVSESPEREEQTSKTAAPGEAGEGDDQALPEQSIRLRVGVQGGVLSGVGTHLMGRAALFFEARDLICWAPDLALRAPAVGARGASDTSLGTIEQAFRAGRLEICPLSFGGEVIAVSHCAAGELGQLHASGPLSDAALWGAVGAHARGVWALAPPFALEADVGANLPLSKYELVAGSTVLYRSATVGISAALGASFTFQ